MQATSEPRSPIHRLWWVQVLDSIGGDASALALLMGRLKAVPLHASSTTTVMAQLKAATTLITHEDTSVKTLRHLGRALVNGLVNARLPPACTFSDSSSSDAAEERVGVACLEAVQALLSRSAATRTSFAHDKSDQGLKILSAAFGSGQRAAVREAALRCVLVVACKEALREQALDAMAQVNIG
jgi:hypothetical protein